MSINERIKEIRKANKLTQSEFAERLSLTMSSISQTERGVINPSRQTIDLICREFRINREWLESGEGEMNLPPLDEVAVILDEVMNRSEDDPVYKACLSFIHTYQSLDSKSQDVIKTMLNDMLQKLGV